MTSPSRLLLLYNEPVLPEDHPDAASEREIIDTVETIGRLLDESGHEVTRFGLGNDLQPLLDVLTNDPPDAVFNLFEGLADRPFTETVVAGILEWFGMPFTGTGSDTLTLARDKQRTKLMLRGADLPTAPFFHVERLPVPPCKLHWPVIVKPAQQDASVGIEQASVVTNQAQLEKRVAYVLERYGPALVEQFVEGREFLVSVIEPPEGGLEVLPLAEIVFRDPELWPIYSYEAKWATTSREYDATPLDVPVTVPDDWMARISDVARRAYRLLGCRDFARIDMRVTEDGQPYILEINPNPFINSIALIDGLEAVGRQHAQFVADLAAAALARREESSAMRNGRMQEAT